MVTPLKFLLASKMLLFRRYVEEWKEETRFSSSMREKESSSAYRGIIAMGDDAVPLLMQELEREPDWWFAALVAITGEDPVPEEDRGDLGKMTGHWLRWGKARGL